MASSHCGCVYSALGTSIRRNNGRYHAYREHHQRAHLVARYGNTMASVIANQFGEADGLKLSALIGIGLLLFLITAVINLIAKFIMKNYL